MITAGRSAPCWHAIPARDDDYRRRAVGALIAGNSGKELKQLGGGFGKLFKGPRYAKKDYLDTIFLVSRLMKMLRTDGPVAVEPHIEDPRSSPIFAEYPKLLKDETLIHLIADTLRLVVVSSGPWIRTRSRR
jgi:chemotaxis protein MotA